jgi:hypothetical protein
MSNSGGLDRDMIAYYANIYECFCKTDERCEENKCFENGDCKCECICEFIMYNDFQEDSDWNEEVENDLSM